MKIHWLSIQHHCLSIASEVPWENYPFSMCWSHKVWVALASGESLDFHTPSSVLLVCPMSSSPVLCNCLMAISCLLCFLSKVILNRVNPRTSFHRMCLVVGREISHSKPEIGQHPHNCLYHGEIMKGSRLYIKLLLQTELGKS